MTAPLFAGIGGHHSPRSKTDEWLTPPSILSALGGWQSFGLDPCAPIARPWPTARHHYTVEDNGLLLSWRGFGRIWLNPPYSTEALRCWLARMAAHDHGTALIFARTETATFFDHVWASAAAVLFVKGRLNFHYVDGRRADKNSGAPSVLVAYGMDDADILAGCSIAGQFVPLRIPRSVLVEAIGGTWRELVSGWMKDRGGAVPLAELYKIFAAHPKARSNPTWRATLRRTLQEGPFQRVARGVWQAEPLTEKHGVEE